MGGSCCDKELRWASPSSLICIAFRHHLHKQYKGSSPSRKWICLNCPPRCLFWYRLSFGSPLLYSICIFTGRRQDKINNFKEIKKEKNIQTIPIFIRLLNITYSVSRQLHPKHNSWAAKTDRSREQTCQTVLCMSWPSFSALLPEEQNRTLTLTWQNRYTPQWGDWSYIWPYYLYVDLTRCGINYQLPCLFFVTVLLFDRFDITVTRPRYIILKDSVIHSNIIHALAHIHTDWYCIIIIVLLLITN